MKVYAKVAIYVNTNDECNFLIQSPDMAAWQNDYLKGTGCEMYTETISPTFTGMAFSQAAE